jgi:hypothetical protein
MNRLNSRWIKRKMRFWPPSMNRILVPKTPKVKPKDTETYYKKKKGIHPTILSVTEPHEVIHGERAVQKQIPKYLHRHTNDVDILTPTPYADAMEAEQALDKKMGRDLFYIDKGMHPGTWRVKSRTNDESVADYTKPTDDMPPHKKINGHNYVTLSYIQKHNKNVLIDPSSRFRHKKDQDTLNRIKIARRKK